MVREGHGLKELEVMGLRRIFGGWRKLHNEELSLQFVIFIRHLWET
jgi:hypothetical protein